MLLDVSEAADSDGSNPEQLLRMYPQHQPTFFRQDQVQVRLH